MDTVFVIVTHEFKELNNRAITNSLPVLSTYLTEVCFSVLTSIKMKTGNINFVLIISNIHTYI